MKAELTATIEGGLLKPDSALPFPDHSRVKLTIESAEPEDASTAAPAWNPVEAREAWLRLLARIDAHPIVGVRHYTREELYERD
jgi:hypothetical protein